MRIRKRPELSPTTNRVIIQGIRVAGNIVITSKKGIGFRVTVRRWFGVRIIPTIGIRVSTKATTHTIHGNGIAGKLMAGHQMGVEPMVVTKLG